ncbi:MAG: hypothetical protein LUG98_05220, partial [Tannerellaceae bacterium]|nr:hypothetical protein [Tannerellaceae bacterium]
SCYRKQLNTGSMKKLCFIFCLFLLLSCDKKSYFIEEDLSESRSDPESDTEPEGWKPPSIVVDSTQVIIEDTIRVF